MISARLGDGRLGRGTTEGIARVKAARTRHGLYSAESQEQRAVVVELQRLPRELVDKIIL